MASAPIPLLSVPQRVAAQSSRRELSSSRADGMVHARLASQTVSPSSGKRETRRWVVEWVYLPDAQREAMEAAWLSTNGGAQPTFWAPPGESPLSVHILEWESAANGPLWSIRAVLEEAI